MTPFVFMIKNETPYPPKTPRGSKSTDAGRSRFKKPANNGRSDSFGFVSKLRIRFHIFGYIK